MKAIYLNLGEKVYKLNQDTRIPNLLEYMPTENKSSINTDEALKTVVETLEFSTMESSGIKSNGQRFNDLKRYLIKKRITQIYNLYDRFKIAIDYSLNNGICELSRNIVIKDMTSTDAVILLGVGTNSECVYRRVKDLKGTLDFGITVPVPLGISSPGTKEYKLTIHDISFYIDTKPYIGDVHNSIYNTPCGCSAYSSTISQNLKDYTLLYSTSVEGLAIQDLQIKFMPRKVSLDILLTYAGLTVVYDDKEINDIIKGNIRHKYHPHHDPHTHPNHPNHTEIPDSDYLPDADGCTKPDKHGWFDYWEKCNATTPYAKLVVEDLTPDSIYDQKTMVKISKIIKDIPTIQIGEYVHYVEAIEDDPITHHSHPYPHHHHHCDNNEEPDENESNPDEPDDPNHNDPYEPTPEPSNPDDILPDNPDNTNIDNDSDNTDDNIDNDANDSSTDSTDIYTELLSHLGQPANNIEPLSVDEIDV